MQLNRLFDTLEMVQSTANWRAVFGEPQAVEGKTLIPLAEVKYGFGLGYGQAEEEADTPAGEGGGTGAGGGISARPLGVLEVTPEGVRLVPVVDPSRMATAAMALAAWMGFWTLRTLGRVLQPRSG